ncbi:hypothetical protein VE04_07381 [Pseudogymnoascus sp. 24MN13]|nr:hypothetical protein VE04_07381 [Pseudogymnoascus sp. 24MN13]
MGGCDDEETEVVQDTNNHSENGDQTCTGGIQTYCCKGFKSAPTKEELEEMAKEKAEEVAEEAAEQAALDIAAKAFCHIAVPALLAPLEALEAFIPIIGEILDIAELAATPALIQLFFGKEHSITFDKPTKTVSRNPKSSHSSAQTSSCPASKRGLNTLAARVDAGCKRGRRTVTSKSITTEIELVTVAHPTAILCDGSRGYPAACLNYQSISANYPKYATITCPYRKVDSQRMTALWDDLIAHADGCSPDEYPPAVMISENDGYAILTSMARTFEPIANKMSAKPPATEGQMVRYLDSVENQNAGKLFNRANRPKNVPTEYYFSKIVMTRSAYTLEFANLGNSPDYGIADNDCVPTFENAKHPGYALFNDIYFDTHADEKALQPIYLLGPSEGNSTRVATPKELQEELPFESCADETCSREIEALKRVVQTMREQAEIDATPLTSPSEVSVELATPVTGDDALVAPASQPKSGSGIYLAHPRQTGVSHV